MKKTILILLYLFAWYAPPASGEDTIPQMHHELLLADEGNGTIHRLNIDGSGTSWSAVTPNRDMQLIGNGRLLAGSNGGDGFSILSLSTGKITRKVKVSGVTSGINSVFMVSENEFCCACDGSPARIYKIDSAGKVLSTITLSIGASVRICRPTIDGTFLVGGKISGMMYEFDAKGNKIWECNAGGEPYMALRLFDGNTLISNGYGGQMVLADRDGAVLRKFPAESGKQKNPQFWKSANPNFFAGFQILENGNVVVSNWQGHGAGHGTSGYQLIEMNGTLTDVVSFWKQDAALVSSLHGVLVLDDLDLQNAYTDRSGPLTVLSSPVLVHGSGMHPVRQYSAFRASGRSFDLHGRLFYVNSHPNPGITVTVAGTDGRHSAAAFRQLQLFR